MGMSILKIK